MIAHEKVIQIDNIIDYALKFSKKNVLQKVSEWAEQNRVLSSKVAKKSGSFSFDYAPYTREIADCFSKGSPVREVAVMKGVQLCFTTSIYDNTIGYCMAYDPSAIMLVSADKGLLKDYKKIKIDDLIDSSGLRERVMADTGNRNSRRQGDTATMIEFVGGFLRLSGSHNANDLKTFPIKILLLDELDGYPEEIKGEGNPINLAVARTDSYGKDKKIGYISTPSLAHSSHIYEYYEKGDKRKYYVPCPFCGEMQELVFYERNGGLYPDEMGILQDGVLHKPYGLIFDSEACKNGDYSSVGYKCKHCGNVINEHYKSFMLRSGKWKPTAKSKVPYYRSYHISALYSPSKEWWEIAKDFIQAGNDPTKLKVFYNLDLGLPFNDTTAGISVASIHKLRDLSLNNNVLPKEALFLTAAVDVQDDRLEVEIKAWGDRFRNWGIDHRIIKGNTEDSTDPCWEELLYIKDELWGGKQITYMLIDSGDGDKTDLVYNFCANYGDGIIFPLKGLASTSRTKEKYKIVNLPDYDTQLVEIYVDSYKNQLARWFNQEWRESDKDYPDGWVSLASGYSDSYLRQLTAEQRIKEISDTGFVNIRWINKGKRNEAFDLNVYNLCCAEIFINEYSRKVLDLDGPSPILTFETLKKEAT